MSHDAPTGPIPAELSEIRRSIDNIDIALVHLLAERFKLTKRVGHLKAERDLPPADPDREADQIARLREHARAADLDPAFAEKFLTFVIAEVIRHHEVIRGSGEDAPTSQAPAVDPDSLPAIDGRQPHNG